MARAGQSGDEAEPADGLTRREHDILAFERQWWKFAGSKEEAIREIVRSLHHAGALAEADLESITRMVLAREELGTTGAGQGVAIPETRHPAIKRVIGTIALSRRGVEWDAMDGEPVDVLFLLISPPRQPGNHLRALEIVGWLYRNERFRDRLRQAVTREQVIALLDEADQEVP